MSISSIASVAEAANQGNAHSTMWALLIMLAALAVSIGGARAMGVFRFRRIEGPLRADPAKPIWPVGAAFGLGMFVLIYSSGACGNLKPNWIGAILPHAMTFAFLYATEQALKKPLRLRLGLTARRFPGGVAKGLLALIVVIPLMLYSSAALEAFYQHVGYSHDAEHPLLKMMGEAQSPMNRWLLIGGAVLAAPFAEEFLFRGFLQTALRQALTPQEIETAPPAQPAGLDGIEDGSIALDYERRPVVILPGVGRAGRTWVALILTSLAFAAIHPPWTAPLIFVLAICLGYAYERTGSLWTPITIHLGFNTISTAWYLHSLRA